MDLEQKFEQMHSMLTQLIGMVSAQNKNLNDFKLESRERMTDFQKGQDELRKDVNVLQAGQIDLQKGQDELRRDVNVLQVGQDELRKDVNVLRVGQNEIRDELVGFRAEFRERLSIQRSQIAENTEDIQVLKKVNWQTNTR